MIWSLTSTPPEASPSPKGTEPDRRSKVMWAPVLVDAAVAGPPPCGQSAKRGFSSDAGQHHCGSGIRPLNKRCWAPAPAISYVAPRRQASCQTPGTPSS